MAPLSPEAAPRFPPLRVRAPEPVGLAGAAWVLPGPALAGVVAVGACAAAGEPATEVRVVPVAAPDSPAVGDDWEAPEPGVPPALVGEVPVPGVVEVVDSGWLAAGEPSPPAPAPAPRSPSGPPCGVPAEARGSSGLALAAAVAPGAIASAQSAASVSLAATGV
ncbi:MAG: hypothetical protein KGJ43_05305 [Acidobacteriota bacterium]|nr:hypothetical protein [Acidobacteriota bacterium]